MDERKLEVLDTIRERFIELSNSFSELSDAFEQLQKRYLINPNFQESYSYSQELEVKKDSNQEGSQERLSSVEVEEDEADDLDGKSHSQNRKYYTSILSKVYRVKLFSNKGHSQQYAYRVYISLYNKSLCLGPYKEKELALAIRSKITRGLKKFHDKDCANPNKYFNDIISYYQKMKSKLDTMYPPLEMKRNKKFYKYSNRKINN